MVSDSLRMSNKFNNYQVVLIFLFGILFVIYTSIFLEWKNITIPYTILTVSYFFIFSFLSKKYSYAFFLCLSLIFISIYFSVIGCGILSFKCSLDGLKSFHFPVLSYNFLLVPISFLGISLNYYNLSKEWSRLFKIPVLGYLIAILIKKELINHRYGIIMEAFYARGLNTRSILNKYKLMPKWIIPLVVTTLMEGLESHDYNVMLKTDVRYLNRNRKNKFSPFKLFIVFIILIALISGSILWKNI